MPIGCHLLPQEKYHDGAHRMAEDAGHANGSRIKAELGAQELEGSYKQRPVRAVAIVCPKIFPPNVMLPQVRKWCCGVGVCIVYDGEVIVKHKLVVKRVVIDTKANEHQNCTHTRRIYDVTHHGGWPREVTDGTL